MRHLKKWIVRILPIAIAVAAPACKCGAQVGPVSAGAGANVSR
jgi:hypothetical protein